MLKKVYAIKESIKFKQTQNEKGMAIDMATGDMMELNDTAFAIFSKVNGQRTVENIVCELAKEYEVDKEDIMEDIAEVFERLLNTKFIEELQVGKLQTTDK
ncbi:MAG: PqqD family protein [Oligoflexia bacterium]|nr:PqqD family protein [Oligoflexia bacterium]